MTTLVLEFKKIENDDKTRYDSFYSHLKGATIINGSDNNDILNQSIPQLYQTDLSLKHVWLPHAKVKFNCYGIRSNIMLWCEISMKLNIDKKITGLEIMILNYKKSSMFQNL